MVVYGGCLLCRNLFTYNPDLVPSHRVNGVREPICRDCMNMVNSRRVGAGLEPFWVSPDAYEAAEC